MDRTVNILKSLAEPTRLRLVAMCRSGGDLAVSEFVRILGQSQPRVSRHLRLLTEAGVLLRVPEGSWVFYRLAPEPQTAALIDRIVENIPADDSVLSRDRDRLAQVKLERRQAAEAYFSENAKSWDRIRAMHIDQAEVNAALRQMMGGAPIRKFLDIGTGTGEMLRLFADRIETGEGIDMSRGMLAVARAALEAEGLGHCFVRHGDLFALPFEDASFDAVLMHQVLHYIDDLPAALSEAGRVLRPGGRMLIADFARHEIEELRAQHQHRRLGFADHDFDAALAHAGLRLGNIVHLPGKPLTVTLWLATKPAAQIHQEPAA